MSKYYNYKDSGSIRPEKQEVHPVWRGVGFLFMVLAPVLGWFGAQLLLDANQKENWVNIPRDFLAPGKDPLLFVHIGVAILLTLLVFFVLQFIGMILYRIAGPERYGPLDVPPITGVKKKRAR